MARVFHFESQESLSQSTSGSAKSAMKMPYTVTASTRSAATPPSIITSSLPKRLEMMAWLSLSAKNGKSTQLATCSRKYTSTAVRIERIRSYSRSHLWTGLLPRISRFARPQTAPRLRYSNCNALILLPFFYNSASGLANNIMRGYCNRLTEVREVLHTAILRIHISCDL